MKYEYFNNKLSTAFILSVIVVVLVAFVSIMGVLNPDEIYKTAELSGVQVPNDYATLFFALPVIAICLLFAAKGRLIALICLPGGLYYFTYNYIVYAFDVPLGISLLLYLLIVGLSLIAIFMILSGINMTKVGDKLRPVVPSKLAGIVLLLLGMFIAGFQSSEIMSVINGSKESLPSIALCFADIAIGAPILIVSGIYLLRKKDFGYVAGGTMLFSYIYQCLGLVVGFVISSVLTNTALDLEGTVTISFMAILCFVPFLFFIKGAKKQDSK